MVDAEQEGIRYFSVRDLTKASKMATARQLVFLAGVIVFMAFIGVGAVLLEENDMDLYLPLFVLLYFVFIMGVVFFLNNKTVMASPWGMIYTREFFNQSQISYVHWSGIKKISPGRRGALRFHRVISPVSIPRNLHEVAPDGSLMAGDPAIHPLLPLVYRYCQGVKIHKKLVEPLRNEDPALFQEYTVRGSGRGNYYTIPSVPSY